VTASGVAFDPALLGGYVVVKVINYASEPSLLIAVREIALRVHAAIATLANVAELGHRHVTR
jgi:hypothetical protein